MKYILPPQIKIYEALGALGDNRIELITKNESKCYSSSRGKFYTIKFDGNNKIYSNDNGTFWKNYLGYPSIAYLMFIGKISYDKKYESALKGIVWKDINQNFKNDFIKTTIYIHEILKNKGYNLDKFEQEIKNIYNQIINLDLEILEPKHKPPEGY